MTFSFVILTFCVSRRRRKMYCGHPHLCVCLSVCLSMAACLHYCTDPDVTWWSGRGCPLVVHYWPNLHSVHGLCCYVQHYGNASQSPAVICQAHRTHYACAACVRRAAKTPLTGDKIDAPAACAIPFRPYCGGVVARTQNVSEYILVLALCLIVVCNGWIVLFDLC